MLFLARAQGFEPAIRINESGQTIDGGFAGGDGRQIAAAHPQSVTSRKR
jgi:hypothetical protein